jgi:hypothetical protein
MASRSPDPKAATVSLPGQTVVRNNGNDSLWCPFCGGDYRWSPRLGDGSGRGRAADLPIFRSLDNSSLNNAHVRRLHRIDPNINGRR